MSWARYYSYYCRKKEETVSTILAWQSTNNYDVYPYSNSGERPWYSQVNSLTQYSMATKDLTFTNPIPEGVYNVKINIYNAEPLVYENVQATSSYITNTGCQFASWTVTETMNKATGTTTKTATTNLFMSTNGIRFTGKYVKVGGLNNSSYEVSYNSYAYKSIVSIELTPADEPKWRTLWSGSASESTGTQTLTYNQEIPQGVHTVKFRITTLVNEYWSHTVYKNNVEKNFIFKNSTYYLDGNVSEAYVYSEYASSDGGATEFESSLWSFNRSNCKLMQRKTVAWKIQKIEVYY